MTSNNMCEHCGNHEFIEKCKACKVCDKSTHIMVFGIDWGKQTKEPCPQHCTFTMPNNNIMNYNCTLLIGHNAPCNFGVDTKALSRMARDMRG